MPNPTPNVSLPRNWFVALIVGVCVLSAAIGSGLALIAQEGPAGPAGKRGERGPAGPRGPEGASATDELGGIEAELEELRGQVGEAEELEGRIEGLEEEVSGFDGGIPDEICEETGIC